ncbi:hypothetical protein GF371_00255 [Candidatus Woesearchaeota archaeon]|nr:hypothetical protein [Candidatus Woesearchaeota archaeon]
MIMVFKHRGETAVLICLVVAAVLVVSLVSIQTIGQSSSMSAVTGNVIAEPEPAIVKVPSTTEKIESSQEINSTLNL